MLITLYTMGGVQIRLLGTNGFHVKAKNERSTAASFRCRQNLKYENRRMADYVKTLHQKACRTCSTIILLHSTNQITDSFVALSLTLPSSNLKLPDIKPTTRVAPSWL